MSGVELGMSALLEGGSTALKVIVLAILVAAILATRLGPRNR
jgi:hypothetical protein